MPLSTATKMMRWIVIAAAACIVVGICAMLGPCESSNQLDRGPVESTIDISPDGKSLVFTGVGTGGNLDLYLLDLETHTVEKLTNTLASETNPGFSPDGKQIVFARYTAPDKPRYLYILDVATRGERPLTAGTPTSDDEPSFSQDGKLVVFARSVTLKHWEKGDYWGDTDIYTVKPDGSDIKQMTFSKFSCRLAPRLHRAGGELIYMGTSGEGDNEVLTIVGSFGGRGARVRTIEDIAQTFCYDPYLFDDGKRLMFAMNPHDDTDPDLSFCDLDRPVLARSLHLTSVSGIPHCPVVPADGRHVYFIDGYGSGLWEADTTGAHPQKIAGGSIFADPTHWTYGN